MIYDIFYPSQELKNIVKQYVVINSLQGIQKLLFLPSGCNFIVFNRGLEGYTKIYNEEKKFFIPQNYSVSVKTNRAKKVVLTNEDNLNKIKFPIILVELTPIGYYQLFNKEASSLNSNYEELERSIVDKYFNELYSRKSVEKEIQYLNTSLISLQSTQNTLHLPIYDVIDKIINVYHYEVSVENLIKEFGCSRSTMEREFKKVVGLTPKNFMFVSKFCKTVLLYIGEGRTFKDIEYLYSDSSHMNAVFKKFLGLSPSAVLNEVMNNNIQIYQINQIRE
jgi:AraC-like DNA-binding protein